MLLSKQIKFWDIMGTVYDFEKAGDVLPKHNHDETNVHITIVARGSVKASSHDWEVDAKAGAILDFRPHEPHEIVALEDNTRIVNIVKKYSVIQEDLDSGMVGETVV